MVEVHRKCSLSINGLGCESFSALGNNGTGLFQSVWRRSNGNVKPPRKTLRTLSPFPLTWDGQAEDNTFADFAYSFHALGDKVHTAVLFKPRAELFGGKGARSEPGLVYSALIVH